MERLKLYGEFFSTLIPVNGPEGFYNKDKKINYYAYVARKI